MKKTVAACDIYLLSVDCEDVMSLSKLEKWRDVNNMAKFLDWFVADSVIESVANSLQAQPSDIETKISLYREEAQSGLNLFRHIEIHGSRTLELGAGAGLFSAWLIECGFDHYALELKEGGSICINDADQPLPNSPLSARAISTADFGMGRWVRK